MKYVIPRNKQIPDPSFQEVINSGPVMKDEAGHAKGDRIVVYRGSDPSLPDSAMIPVGMLYFFDKGVIYVPDKALSYFEIVVEPLRAGVAFVGGELAGGLAEAALGVLSQIPGRFLSEVVEETIYPEREAESLRIEELVKRGAVYMPGVQIVEIEGHVVPGGFLRKDKHRVVLTFERLDGQRTTYTVFGSSEKLFDAYAGAFLGTRQECEIDYLVPVIKAEQVNVELLEATCIQKYKSLYGDEWIKHVNELVAEFYKAANEELERKGFTLHHINAKVLERLAPLLPYYRQVPKLKDWVRVMEEMAATQPASAPSA